MSWGSLFGRPAGASSEASSIPAATPLQRQRCKQIESLSVYNSNVIEEERDREYSISFTAAGRSFTLRIALSLQFPNEKPIARLSPNASHPWLDDQMYVIGCGNLNSFYMHSNLGKVVKEMIQDFKENIRSDLPVNMTSLSNEDQAANFLSMKSTKTDTPTAMLICTDSIDSDEEKFIKKDPSECKSIEELLDVIKDMPIEEIEKLYNNSESLLGFIANMDIATDLQHQRLALVESNNTLAEQNLAFKPNIEEAKENFKASLVKIESLESEFKSNSRKQDELFQVFDLHQIITNLRIAVSQAEESSEELADRFLEKKMPLDEFLKRFLDERKLVHMRKSKEERIRYLNPEY